MGYLAKAHRLLYHSTLGSRVIKKKKKKKKKKDADLSARGREPRHAPHQILPLHHRALGIGLL